MTYFIVETDLPGLVSKPPAYLQNRSINLQEFIPVTIEYDASDPETLFYTAVLVYEK